MHRAGRIRSLIVIAALALCPTASAAEFGPYRATVLRVIDGDTLEVRAEIWPRQSVQTLVRLAGVDTPETKARSDCERRAARAATAFVRAWVAERAALRLIVTGRDKYGRDLGRIVNGDEDLAAALMAAGHARRYNGERRRAWCE